MTEPLYCTGLLPQREGDDRFDIDWAHEHLGTDLDAAISFPINVTQGKQITWKMFGNGPDPTLTIMTPNGLGQPVGDCFFAAWGNERILAITLGELDDSVTANGQVTLYLKYDRDQDLGVVLADALLWLYQNGYIKAFAPVRLDTADAVQAQVQRGLLAGTTLTSDAQAITQSGGVWNVDQGQQPDPEEGHCILRIIRAAADGNTTWVTWSQEQQSTPGWDQVCVNELWLELNDDDRVQMGETAWQKLIGQLDALPDARGLQVNPPAPNPNPAPPAQGSDTSGLLHAIGDILHWIAEHI